LGAGVHRKFEGVVVSLPMDQTPKWSEEYKYGMTNVNFRFLGYREQPFVIAKDVIQVFYVKDSDPANKEEHHIVLQGKRKIVGVEDVDEEEHNQFNALPPFDEDITIPTIDVTEEPTPIHHDHDEAIIVR
jgi:hypothetical protein